MTSEEYENAVDRADHLRAEAKDKGAIELICANCRGMEHKLFTLRDLANRFKRFGLSIAWFKAEAEAKRIPCFKAGRKLLFDPDAVEQSLLARARAEQVGKDEEQK